MTSHSAPRRTASRAAKTVAALGAAASVALAAPGAANAAIAIPEVPEWVSQILPTPEQVTDWSGQYDQIIAGLGGEDVRGAISGWNDVAGAIPGGLLPTWSSTSTVVKGNPKRPSDGSGVHFRSFLERADMKGFYDLMGKSNVDMLNLAELFGPADKIVLTKSQNVTSFESLLLSGTTTLSNSYGHMPAFKVLGQDVPEFIVWIPEAQGDYTSIAGSGFGFHNSMPTMALPGIGAIPLPHSAGYVTAPFGLGGASYYLKTQLPALGADGSMGLVLPAFGGALDSPFGTLGFGFDKGASVSILDGGLGLGLGAPTLTWIDPLGTTHTVDFTLGGISYTEKDGLKLDRPGIEYKSTPAPETKAGTFEAPLVTPQVTSFATQGDGAGTARSAAGAAGGVAGAAGGAGGAAGGAADGVVGSIGSAGSANAVAPAGGADASDAAAGSGAVVDAGVVAGAPAAGPVVADSVVADSVVAGSAGAGAVVAESAAGSAAADVNGSGAGSSSGAAA